MNLRLNALKANVTKTFIIIVFASSAVLNENRLLSKINKMFIRFFLIKGFFEFDFLREIITTTIQFINMIREALYMFMLHRQLNKN